MRKGRLVGLQVSALSSTDSMKLGLLAVTMGKLPTRGTIIARTRLITAEYMSLGLLANRAVSILHVRINLKLRGSMGNKE